MSDDLFSNIVREIVRKQFSDPATATSEPEVLEQLERDCADRLETIFHRRLLEKLERLGQAAAFDAALDLGEQAAEDFLCAAIPEYEAFLQETLSLSAVELMTGVR